MASWMIPSMCTVLLFSTLTTVDAQSFTSLGCFLNEDYSISGVNEMVTSGKVDNSINNCGNTCYGKGFRYMGLKNGNICLCGSTYDKSSPRTDCSKQCSGASSQTCGGATSANVYTTGKACFTELHDKELYYIPDPTQTTITVSGETYAKQYTRRLGHEGCKTACAVDPDCVAYTYFTQSVFESGYGERCFGFTIYANTGLNEKSNMVSGQEIPCGVSDPASFTGEMVGMIIGILCFLGVLGFIMLYEKKLKHM